VGDHFCGGPVGPEIVVIVLGHALVASGDSRPDLGPPMGIDHEFETSPSGIG